MLLHLRQVKDRFGIRPDARVPPMREREEQLGRPLMLAALERQPGEPPANDGVCLGYESPADRLEAGLLQHAFSFLAPASLQGGEAGKGKSISSGSPGSGQYQLLTDLLKVHGMTRADIKEDLSSFTQAVDKIKDGNLDATLITAGVPTAAVTDFAQSHALKVIPLAGPEIAELQKQQPFYASGPLPANTYKGQPDAVNTLAVMAVWTSHDGVPDNVAYEVTKALFENTAIMGQVHVQGKNISLATATAVGNVPIHPGALKYFKEKGIVK